MTDPTGSTYRDSYRASFGERGRLWHVRGVVDGMLVVRCWTHSKGWWHEIKTMPVYLYEIGAIRNPGRKLKAWLREQPAEQESQPAVDTATPPR